ncbi:hypothetical protein DXG01_012815 [Tephrocybe rancida]|nr:hypothetical protein DXG01_012815 [Tephrocybe rancida]
MPTVKLVVIGTSGVGKTSLRGQYISGQFSNGYRATIGADFISKTIPHPSNPSSSVVLQIWDTAGQERFSSLSTAFFRGADAVLLMFDVNSPATMLALTKWWAEFRERAPLADEEMEDFCCVVVGNKMDLTGGEERVTEREARTFLAELVPLSSGSPSSSSDPSVLEEGLFGDEEPGQDPLATSYTTIRPSTTIESPTTPRQSLPPRSDSIAIAANSSVQRPSLSHSTKHPLSKSRSRSASHIYGGTMTTTHTTLTIFHTPSSSLFDVYQSARSSPEPWSSPSRSPTSSSSTSPSPYTTVRGRRISTLSTSTGSTSSGSGDTITPSLFARELSTTTPPTTINTNHTPEDDVDPFVVFPPPPARGPKLFFTSAKTGAGVADVFEYIARRVVRRWEYDERIEARRLHVREASAGDTVQLGLAQRMERRGAACCGS